MEIETVIEQKTQELLEKLTIVGSVSLKKEGDTIIVTIDSADAGILIGHHGRSLEALQLILRHLVYKETSTWIPFVVSIGDYREKREQQLKEIAENAARQAEATQKAVILSDLSPFERRIIHVALSEHPTVESYSEGEGEMRRLIIRPKS